MSLVRTENPSASKESWLLTAGGKIKCKRCSAKSKRTQFQCAAPASRGKKVCRFHGGLSTGPRTAEGKERSIAAATSNGQYTRQAKAKLRAELIEVAELEILARGIGLISRKRSKGRPIGWRKLI